MKATTEKDGSASAKRGELIARQIETSILSGAVSLGDRLGSEEDLAAEFGVSRWVMREAIALMELDGMAKSRRRRPGGLYVTSPAPMLRAATLRNFYRFAEASAAQINSMRSLVEGQAVARAMRRLTLEDASKLRSICNGPDLNPQVPIAKYTTAIHSELLRISGQEALSLFSNSLAQANIERLLWYGATTADVEELSLQTWRIRVRQVEAILAFDESEALSCQREIADCGMALNAQFNAPPHDVESAIIRSSKLVRAYDIPDVDKTVKKPEALARLLAQRICDRKLVAGDRLGSESSIILEFGVSRNVLREAVRLLERYGIARPRTGQDGGLRVIEPDPDSIVRATSLYLSPYYAAAPAAFHRVTLALQLEAVDEACARPEQELAPLLANYRESLSKSSAGSVRSEVFGYFDFLAGACHNPILECFMRSLVFQVDFLSAAMAPTDIGRMRELQMMLADAISSKDVALARRLTLLLRETGVRMNPVPRSAEHMLEMSSAREK